MPTEHEGVEAEAEATSTPQVQPKTYSEEYVKQLRAEAKANRLKAEAAEAEAADLRPKAAQAVDVDKLTKLEKLLEAERQAREEATKQAAESKRAEMRLKIAVDAGLPAALASKLSGETEDELRADAEALKPFVTPTNVQQRPTSTTTAVPGGAPQGETDEQKRARIYRNNGNGGVFGP